MSKRTLSDSEVQAHTKNRHAQKNLQKQLQELQHREFQLRDFARVEMQKWRRFQKENLKNSGWSGQAMRPEVGDGDVFTEPSSPDGSMSPTGRGTVGRFQRPWAYTFKEGSHNKVYKELALASENHRQNLRNVSPSVTASPRYLSSSNDNSSEQPKLAQHVSAVTGLERAKSAWGRGEKILNSRQSDMASRPIKSAREHTKTELIDLSETTGVGKESRKRETFERQVSTVQFVERAKSAWTRRDRKPDTSVSPSVTSHPAGNRLARSVTALNGLQKSLNVWICSTCGKEKTPGREGGNGEALRQTVMAYSGVQRAKSALGVSRFQNKGKVVDEREDGNDRRRSRCSCGCISVKPSIPVSGPSKINANLKKSRSDSRASIGEKAVISKKVSEPKLKALSKNVLGKSGQDRNVKQKNPAKSPETPIENVQNVKKSLSVSPQPDIRQQMLSNSPEVNDLATSQSNREDRESGGVALNATDDSQSTSGYPTAQSSGDSPELITAGEKEGMSCAVLNEGEAEGTVGEKSETNPCADMWEGGNDIEREPETQPSSRFVRVYKEISKLPDENQVFPETSGHEETYDIINNDFSSTQVHDGSMVNRRSTKQLIAEDLDIPPGEEISPGREENKDTASSGVEEDSRLHRIHETDECGEGVGGRDVVDASKALDSVSSSRRQSRRASELSAKNEGGDIKGKMGSIVRRWNSRGSDLGRGLKTSSSRLSMMSMSSLDEGGGVEGDSAGRSLRKFSTVSRDSRRKNSTLFRPIAQRVKKTVAAKTADGFFFQVARVLLSKAKERKAEKKAEAEKIEKEKQGQREDGEGSSMTQDQSTAIARGKERVGMRFLRKSTSDNLGFDTSHDAQSNKVRSVSTDSEIKQQKQNEQYGDRHDKNGNVTVSDNNHAVTGEKRRLRKSQSVQEGSDTVLGFEQGNVINSIASMRISSDAVSTNNSITMTNREGNETFGDSFNNNDIEDDRSSVNIFNLLRDRDANVNLSSGVLDYDNRELESIGRPQSQAYHRGVRIKNYVSPQLRYKSAARDRKKKGISVRWHAASGATVTAHQCQDEPQMADVFFPRQARQRELAKLVAENHAQPSDTAAHMADAALQARIDNFLQSVKPFCRTPREQEFK